MYCREKIIDYCKNIGLDTIGFTACRKFDELVEVFEERSRSGLRNEFEAEEVEKRINPFLYLSSGKTIISIAFPYLFYESLTSKSGFSRYTMGEDYHKVVMSYLKNICEYINSLGGEAIALVDNNPLPERYIAYLCGIGFIGRNNMLITKKYGSYVFLGEIITDLQLTGNSISKETSEVALDKLLRYEQCGECSKCFEACPTKAINISRKNPNICLSYITQKKELEDEWLPKLEGRMFGCDTCQLVCPFNEEIQFSNLMEFKPYEFMLNDNLEELTNIDNKLFKDRYHNTSCGWRGKNVLQRNAFIKGFHIKQNLQAKEIKSPYVKDYYDRLLKLFKL